MLNGIFRPDQLDESISNLNVLGSYVSISFNIVKVHYVSKQYRTWSDAEVCGVWTGSALFANVA